MSDYISSAQAVLDKYLQPWLLEESILKRGIPQTHTTPIEGAAGVYHATDTVAPSWYRNLKEKKGTELFDSTGKKPAKKSADKVLKTLVKLLDDLNECEASIFTYRTDSL